MKRKKSIFEENKFLLCSALMIIVVINAIMLFTVNRPSEDIMTSFSISFASVFVKIQHGLLGVGQVLLYVDREFFIELWHPRNDTYYERVISLNVSSNGTVQSWWYSLERKQNNETIFEKVIFDPNSTFMCVRNSNEITVYGNDSVAGNERTKSTSVIFECLFANNAPIIHNISSPQLVCEESQYSMLFNVTEIDWDLLTGYLIPTSPFYVRYIGRNATENNETAPDLNITVMEVYSGQLFKIDTGQYNETLWVTDESLADSKDIRFEVIPINHAPVMDSPGTYTLRANQSFNFQVNVDDTESGSAGSGNITFNMTFIQGSANFSINETYGFINKTFNENEIGTYLARICSADNGLQYVHPNISVCNESNYTKYDCENLQITVSMYNRCPQINTYWNSQTKSNGSLLSLGTIDPNTVIRFGVNVSDADGSTPFVYWYVNDTYLVKNEYSLSSVYDFSVPGAGFFYNITAIVSDGLCNQSITWNLYVFKASISSGTSGGVAGGGKSGCLEKWGCKMWSQCQDIRSLKIEKDVNFVYGKCKEESIKNENCGYQITTCKDTNNCSTTRQKPSEIEGCFYIREPSCKDEIKNCHSGSCEVLTDCGGPCPACPTCSDKIKNQNEENIDCGGPCPACYETPREIIDKKRKRYIIFFLLFILLLLAILILYKILRISRGMERVEKERGFNNYSV